MNLGQMLFNGKCKVFAPFYYIPMEIGIKYFLQGNFSIKIINIMKKYLLLFSLTIFLFACNKDEEISQDVILPPVIELDSEDGIYVVKIGKRSLLSRPIRMSITPFIHGNATVVSFPTSLN